MCSRGGEGKKRGREKEKRKRGKKGAAIDGTFGVQCRPLLLGRVLSGMEAERKSGVIHGAEAHQASSRIT